MRSAIHLLVFVMTFIAPNSIDASPHVTVRIYNPATTRLGDFAPALVTATGILDAAGVAVFWRRCDIKVSGDDACAAPLRANEVAIRFLTSPSLSGLRNQMQLGYSVVDTGAHAGALASVFPERVAMLAREAGMDADLLLGRAIAHEIGHLLLGTTTHPADGLMRAVWSVDALQRNLPKDWLFAKRDAVRMRAGMK